jgi:hypothetical protein
VELSIIIDDLLLRILKAKTGVEIAADVQARVLKEMCGWLLGSETSEVYLNFDIEKGAMTGKSLYRELCATLCTIGENKQAVENEMSLSALHAIGEVMRSLLDMSGHVQYMASSQRVRAMSMSSNGLGGWETLEHLDSPKLLPNESSASSSTSPTTSGAGGANKDDSFSDLSAEVVADEADDEASESEIDEADRGDSGNAKVVDEVVEDAPLRLNIKRSSLEPIPIVDIKIDPVYNTSSSSSSSLKETEDSGTSPKGGAGGRPAGLKKVTSFRARQDEGQRSKGVLAQGLEIYESKSLGKCIAYLIAQNYITDSPREIASFLRM